MAINNCYFKKSKLSATLTLGSTIQIRSKDSQVKTQLVLWIFILLKVTTTTTYK